MGYTQVSLNLNGIGRRTIIAMIAEFAVMGHVGNEVFKRKTCAKPEKAARKLLEIAETVKAVQDGRHSRTSNSIRNRFAICSIRL